MNNFYPEWVLDPSPYKSWNVEIIWEGCGRLIKDSIKALGHTYGEAIEYAIEDLERLYPHNPKNIVGINLLENNSIMIMQKANIRRHGGHI